MEKSTFFKYVVVGALGTLTDIAVLYYLVETSGIDPKTSVFLFVFTTIAFCTAVVQNFIFNKWWTFGSLEKKKTTREFVKFLIVSLVGLMLSNSFMYLFVVSLGLWYVLAKVLTSLCVLVWNFLGNKYWTFRAHHLSRRGVGVVEQGRCDFSIVIPAYNEEHRLPHTLSCIRLFLRTFPYACEVIVVDDGSTDRTAHVAREYFDNAVEISGRVVSAQVNRGKGHAVRLGVFEARGDYILFADADNSTPIEELAVFSDQVDEADILIGSRYLKDSRVAVSQPWYRVLMGRVSNMIIRLFLVDDLVDTQCGFKLFSREAAHDIFSRSTIDGFGFDMEVLALAEALDYRIKELPVAWYDSPDSRVRPVKDALRTFRELVLIKFGLWGGKYK